MRKLYLKNKLLIALSRPFENRRLFTALQLAIYTLQQQRLWPQEVVALDMFAQTGLQWTRIIAPHARYLEMWDIDERAVSYARKEFPNARVICGDSIKALREGGTGRKDFNVVLIDTPMPFRSDDGSFEHFGFLSDVMRHLANRSVLMFNVVSDVGPLLSVHPQSKLFIADWMHARRTYYGTAAGENVSAQHMTEVYREVVVRAGFTPLEVRYSARNQIFGLMTIALSRD
jgi:hypothetical protein